MVALLLLLALPGPLRPLLVNLELHLLQVTGRRIPPIGPLMDMMSTRRSSKNGRHSNSSNTPSTTLRTDMRRLPPQRPRELRAHPPHQGPRPLRATQPLRRRPQRDRILVFVYCQRT
ncbi:hypothetical protein LXA43DRAFT_978393 [Ganoderma leucocontextum]|nr:hypothetical protein LXA43DRAFT_978393 [Ganoderma leucocontextum]